jgi:TPR repeat protein
MLPPFAWRAVSAAVILLGLTAGTVRADFYNLEGRFQCLDDPAAACGDRTLSLATRDSHEIAGVESKRPTASAVQRPAAPLSAVVNPPKALHDKPAGDSIDDIAARITMRRPSLQDLARLHALANEGVARAIELLAWCDYAGVGQARDPIAAYILYGVAASAGVARARENQAVIYEYALSPDQQQLVLDIDNQSRDER